MVLGAAVLLRSAVAGSFLLLLGTLMGASVMDGSLKRILQIPVLKIRLGTWIAWCCFAAGAALSRHDVGSGIALIIFGLLVLSLIGKRLDKNTGDGKDAARR